MNENLNRLLSYLEENIDIEHLQNVERLHLDIINYNGVPFLPLSIIYPIDDEFKMYSYTEAYDNPEKMLYNELLSSFSSTYNSVKLKDYFPLQIRSNHGVGIISSLFGAECKIVCGNMPWVEPIGSIDLVKEIIDKGIPDLNKALGSKVIETHKFFIKKLKEYPKCFSAIHITQPDLQGPFDIAHLLMGPDIFYELYDNPKIVHKLLSLITDTYIAFRKFIEPYLTDKAGEDAVYVHGAIYGGKVVIKDDTAAVNLSEDMYNEFSKQYNERIFKEFEKGTLHHCGQEREWHFRSFENKYLAGINYGNPEMHELEKTYNFWKERKIPIFWWGYNQYSDFLKKTCELNIKTGISLAVKADNFKNAKDILNDYFKM